MTDKPLKCLAHTPKTRQQLFKVPEILERADTLAALQCCALTLQDEINVGILKCFSVLVTSSLILISMMLLQTIFLVPIKKCGTNATHCHVSFFSFTWNNIRY